MKFSIITPSFNQGSYIKDCIESVLSQEGIEFEHIVVDAGSTDDTLEILGKYSHLRWTSEPDEGMSDGINKGFLKATGDWLMWLNCDDYLLPDALKRVSDLIAKDPTADIIHGDCLFVDKDKRVIRRKFDHPIDQWTLFYCGCYVPSTSTFLRSGIIDQGQLVSTHYRVCMDWEYYLRLLRNGFKFSYLPEALAGFRWTGENTSIVLEKKARAEKRLLRAEHLRETGRSYFLSSPIVLPFLIFGFRILRVWKRLKIHRVLR